MARPHIDYLQSQVLPWQTSPWPHLSGCRVKTLSRDPDTGAASLLVHFPSGWSAPAPGPLGPAEELFVIEGVLELDGRRCAQDCYGWFPPGWRHAVRSTAGGAVALAFYGAEPQCTAGTTGFGPRAAGSELVDAFELPWLADGAAVAFGDATRRAKVLHPPHGDGAATMLIASPPHLHPRHWLAPQEIHPVDEESFVLSGDCLSPVGAMASGAYSWQPAGVAHGPYGSRGGNLTLVRIHGAPLSTRHTAHELALERAPQYQPVLPAGMHSLGTRPWRPPRY